MAELSLIEWGVYGFVAYSSLLMLIIQTVKEVPSEKSGSIIRSVYMITGVIAAFIIAGSGENIIGHSVTNTIVAVNTTEVFTETISFTIPLQNAIWITFHYLIGIVMIVYIITQALTLFTKLK